MGRQDSITGKLLDKKGGVTFDTRVGLCFALILNVVNPGLY